jgi:ATP-dependent helicase/nuclease subunit B
MNTALTLTPNRRLARFLRQQNHPGQILAWNDWLIETWQMDYEQINPERPLQCLSDWQSELIWLKIIQEHNGDPLLNKTQAIQQARQAFTLVRHWLCDTRDWAGEKSETDTFLIWMSAYHQYCEKNNVLDPALLPQVLSDYWIRHPDKIPPTLELYGFDEFNPLQTSILELFKSAGCSLQMERVSERTQTYEYLAFPDRQSQMTQAVLHAKSVMESPRNDALPLGIIIPKIQDHWDLVHRVCTEILGAGNFNISAGQPLGQMPIIYAALLCLQGENIRGLMLTPYIRGGLSEQCERALMDERLSRLETDPLPVDFVRSDPELPEQFKQTLNQSLDKIQSYQESWLAPSQWIENIFSILRSWGWPGERTLNSEAYQAVTHFYRLITELASLDAVVGPCPYARVISLLNQRANKTMFQPESNDKPVQVLGVLEAAGLSFSHLWVMDLGSDTWPDKPSPNPFIPMAVQLQLGIPHASFARELLFAQTMMRRLLSSSPNIILSYAQQGDEGEGQVLPSPLIEQRPIASSLWGEGAHTTLAEQLFAMKKTEPLPEALGLPLKTTALKGGATLFKDQADCPFRAYAKHRLSAVSITAPEMGFSSRIKGSVLHDVLELIWSVIKTREGLVNLTQESLDRLIAQNIHLALDSVIPPIAPIERDLEVLRLTPILQRWFELELSREPFKITSLERSYTVTFEGLQLTFRVDRIDEIEGQPCLIDYKTGKVNAQKWLEDRMDEPQLPLYACVIEPTPQAIAFAQIRKDKMAWKGMGSLPLPGITPIETSSWNEQIMTWRAQFALIADEYKRGHAAVTPKNNHQTCTYCDMQPFCRINDDQ